MFVLCIDDGIHLTELLAAGLREAPTHIWPSPGNWMIDSSAAFISFWLMGRTLAAEGCTVDCTALP
jgi:hypothetical protein